jgi:hypothetical protein
LRARFLPATVFFGPLRVRALVRVRWETPAVADPGVAADLHLALDVTLHLAAQVALDLQVLVDPRAQAGDLLVGQVAHPGVARDLVLVADQPRGGAADPEDVGQRDLETLLTRDVDTGDASHLCVLPLVLWSTSLRPPGLRPGLRCVSY